MNIACLLLLALGFIAGFALLSFKRTKVGGIGLLVLAIAGTGYVVYREHRIGGNFHAVAPGMSPAQVLGLLGRPSEINDGSYTAYGYKDQRADAKKSKLTQYWYYSVPRPHVWVVVFDEAGKVVSSREEDSP